MKPIDYLIIGILFLIVAAIFLVLIFKKRKGGSSCNGDCSSCIGGCKNKKEKE